jgi:hypothetical protein
MKVHVFRTAMCGGGLSYDVYVPESECPEHVVKACPGGSYYTRINRCSRSKLMFLDYIHATLSPEHEQMEQGWDRYQSFLEHERQARKDMLLIAAKAFPELAKVQARTDTLPRLWINGLMDPETSAEVILNIDVPQLQTA